MIYFDAHVHIQERFNLDQFLLCALDNFNRQRIVTVPQSSDTCFLLLTEAKSLDFFSKLAQQARQKTSPLPVPWQLRATGEEESLLLNHASRPGVRMFVVAGRQLVTREKLEVLALASLAKIDDGRPLADTVDEVRNCGGLAVLPWGAGKWLGKEGGSSPIISRVLLLIPCLSAIMAGDRTSGRGLLFLTSLLAGEFACCRGAIRCPSLERSAELPHMVLRLKVIARMKHRHPTLRGCCWTVKEISMLLDKNRAPGNFFGRRLLFVWPNN